MNLDKINNCLNFIWRAITGILIIYSMSIAFIENETYRQFHEAYGFLIIIGLLIKTLIKNKK